MPLVRSYRTLAPLPVHLARRTSPGPSAVCFCGTVLTVARTGRYPAGLAIGEPGLSSTERPASPKAVQPSIAITSPAFVISLKNALAIKKPPEGGRGAGRWRSAGLADAATQLAGHAQGRDSTGNGQGAGGGGGSIAVNNSVDA